MTEALQLALDPAVSPPRILLSHPYDQLGDGLHEAWTAHPLRLVGPLQRDQPAMPPHQGVRSDDRRNSIQGLPTEPLGLRGESPSLLIC